MKRIVSWHEFTTTNPRQSGFDCDKWSRIIVKALLLWGYRTLDVDVSFTEGNNCSDLAWISPKTGIRLLGEIKDRYTYNSKSFDDHIIEEIKTVSLMRRLKNNEALYAAIFSIYDDGVIKVTNDITKQGSFLGKQNSICPRTTTLGDNTPIDKVLYRFKPDTLFYFQFEYDDEKNYYKIMFSEKPFNSDNAPQFVSNLDWL